MFGAWKADAAVVPLSTMLKKKTILLELQDAKPGAVFAGLPFLELTEDYDSPDCRFVMEGGADGWIPYEDIQKYESDSEPESKIAPGDLCNIIYSSGTTGDPKGIVHTHQARVHFAMAYGLEFRIHNDAVSLVSTPLYSNGTQLVYLPTILMGGTLVLMRSFDPAGFLKDYQAHYKYRIENCGFLWNHVNVASNGRLRLCCFAPSTREISLGNLADRPFSEIWNSQLVQRMRKKIVSGDTAGIICRKVCSTDSKLIAADPESECIGPAQRKRKASRHGGFDFNF